MLLCTFTIFLNLYTQSFYKLSLLCIICVNVFTFITGGIWSLFFFSWGFYWVFDSIEYIPCFIVFTLLWKLHKYKTNAYCAYLGFLIIVLVVITYFIRQGFFKTKHSFFVDLQTKFFFIYSLTYCLTLLVFSYTSKSIYIFVSSWGIIYSLFIMQLFIKIFYLILIFFCLFYTLLLSIKLLFSWQLLLLHLLLILLVFFLLIKIYNLYTITFSVFLYTGSISPLKLFNFYSSLGTVILSTKFDLLNNFLEFFFINSFNLFQLTFFSNFFSTAVSIHNFFLDFLYVFILLALVLFLLSWFAFIS